MPYISSPPLIITPPTGYASYQPLIGWENKVRFANIIADSSHDSYPVTNLANPSTYLKWLSTSTAVQLVEVDNLTGQSDYVGIARHNFGSGRIEVAVEAITAEPGAVWEEVFPAALLGDDAPAVLRFAKGYYIGIRLRLTPTDGVAPSAAVLFVGALIALRPGLSPGYVPLSRAENIEVLNGRSERGEHLGSIIIGADLRSTAQVQNVDPDYYADDLRPFVKGANRGDPFFWVWSPGKRPDEVSYAWLAGSAQPVISQSTGQIDIALDMGALAL